MLFIFISYTPREWKIDMFVNRNVRFGQLPPLDTAAGTALPITTKKVHIIFYSVLSNNYLCDYDLTILPRHAFPFLFSPGTFV